MKFKILELGSKTKEKQKIAVVLFIILFIFVLADSVIFIQNYSKYSETEKAEASDAAAKYWNHEKFDGRLESVSCEKLKGWVGTKEDIKAQMDVFFTIGGPYEGGGTIFNPEYRANLEREKAVCDFLDGEIGMIEECAICEDTACDHGFEVDLTQDKYKKSAIFNNKANNKIYAYGVYNGQVAALRDGPTFTKYFLKIPKNCGEGWDETSDEIPEGTPMPTPTPTGTSTPDDPVEIPQGINFDFNMDENFDIIDINLFIDGYRVCNDTEKTNAQNSNECKMYKDSSANFDFDFNEDDNLDLYDFIILIKVYKICNNNQNSNECQKYKGEKNETPDASGIEMN